LPRFRKSTDFQEGIATFKSENQNEAIIFIGVFPTIFSSCMYGLYKQTRINMIGHLLPSADYAMVYDLVSDGKKQIDGIF